MKRILASVIFLVLACNVNAQMTEAVSNSIHFLYYTPGNYRPIGMGAGHPLIISLAGQGEEGNGSSVELQNLYIGGIPRKIKEGSNMVFSYIHNGITTTDGFVVLAPQLPQFAGWTNNYVDEMLTYALAHFNIDPARIFLTGYSLGGIGIWDYAFTSANINKFAGIAPISSFANYSNYCNIADKQVAVWAFQGGYSDLGGTNPTYYTSQINGCSNLVVPAFDTNFVNFTHSANFWDNYVYALDNSVFTANIYQWMLMVNRNLDVPNNASPKPIIKFGSNTGPNLNVNLVAPVLRKDFPVFDGSSSYDPDDIIMSYLWEQDGGPVTLLPPPDQRGAIDRARQLPVNAASVPQDDLDPNVAVPLGTYTFRLRVKDYLTSKVTGSNEHTKFATLVVNVKVPDGTTHTAPAVDAGPDIVLTSGQTFVRRKGNALAYGSNINLSNWTFISGPQTPQLKDYNYTITGNSYPNNGGDYVGFTGMDAAGTYIFEYSVSTDQGDQGSDRMSIIRPGAATLPVSLLFLKGENAGSKNVISWATSQEINSDRFDILRSTDGVSFTKIGSLASKGGSVTTEYTFDDVNAPAGNGYYRLSQVDKDGKTTLSKIITVTNNTRLALAVEKYPNPVHDNLTITAAGTVNGTLQVTIADMQGKTILQQQWQKNQSLLKNTINVGILQKGVYQMIVTIGQEKQVSSFVKY